ncbi:oxidoreductase [Streptomyces sp. 35G-GA-8]|uniref:oxidoreductase n=1 Tax=Streptomyces sp. 35G-GA-8 TaxID=2939434 RepID=UPI00201F10A4|nr:oxidoreductase [Streptomyces sp. 35G-GA-8]MCL7378636.1 oxidoreductase [Streptomyces sp. 35G-GA-8]
MIPLGPLGLGEILNGTFATMGRYWKQLFGVAAVVYGAATAAVAIALAVAYATVGDRLREVIDTPRGVDPSWTDVRPLLIAFGCVWLFGMAVLVASNAFVQATCPSVVQSAVLGRPTTFGAVWRRALARFPAVLGAVLLSGLIAVLPAALFLLAFVVTLITSITLDGSPDQLFWLIPLGFLGALALTPPAIWLWVRLSLAPAVAVIESRGPLASLRRSADLVRGSWWRICGISLLAFAMAAFAGLVLQQLVNAVTAVGGLLTPSTLGGDPTVGQVLVAVSGYLVLFMVAQLMTQLITTTFPQLVLNLLYVDRRIRTENLAPTLAEAARTPPQG